MRLVFSKHFWKSNALHNSWFLIKQTCERLVLNEYQMLLPPAGSDLTDARPQANPLVRPPLPLLQRKTESVNQFAKIGKWRSETEKVQSVKNSKSLLEWPRSLRLLLPSTQKRSIARNCWNPTSWLAGTGFDCHRQANLNRHNWNIWQNT